MDVWYPIIAGFVGQSLVGAFIYGRLSQKVNQNSADLEDHESRLRIVESKCPVTIYNKSS